MRRISNEQIPEPIVCSIICTRKTNHSITLGDESFIRPNYGTTEKLPINQRSMLIDSVERC